jgi:hypothetical protein
MITIAQRFRRPRKSRPYADAMSLPDALRELDAREAAGNAALSGMPTFTPHPRPYTPTAPQPALREAGRGVGRPVPQHRQQAMPVLRRVRDALARGLTPLADATAAEHVPAGRLPQVSARRVFTAEKRLARVPLPGIGGDYDAYLEYLAAVDRITGTTGPRPVFASAGTEGSDGE